MLQGTSLRGGWDSRRKLKRMIKRTAKKQSQLVYDQTVKLYNDILTSNLQKIVDRRLKK